MQRLCVSGESATPEVMGVKVFCIWIIIMITTTVVIAIQTPELLQTQTPYRGPAAAVIDCQ